MRLRRLVAALAFGALAAVACSGGPAPSKAASLGDDVARVGTTSVPAALIASLSRGSGQPPRKVLDGVVADSLAASAATAGGLATPEQVRFATDATLVRHLVRAVAKEAAAEGPPKPEELESLKVEHAVVLRSARIPELRAKAVAYAIRRAVEGARSADDFEARAAATPHADTQVVVESLDPFLADGRSPSGEGGLDSSFVAGAFELHAPGQLSAVVESSFGWHVIYLVARAPADISADAARATMLAGAVAEMRVRDWVESHMRSRTQRFQVEVSGALDALLAEVKLP